MTGTILVTGEARDRLGGDGSGAPGHGGEEMRHRARQTRAANSRRPLPVRSRRARRPARPRRRADVRATDRAHRRRSAASARARAQAARQDRRRPDRRWRRHRPAIPRNLRAARQSTRTSHARPLARTAASVRSTRRACSARRPFSAQRRDQPRLGPAGCWPFDEKRDARRRHATVIGAGTHLPCRRSRDDPTSARRSPPARRARARPWRGDRRHPRRRAPSPAAAADQPGAPATGTQSGDGRDVRCRDPGGGSPGDAGGRPRERDRRARHCAACYRARSAPSRRSRRWITASISGTSPRTACRSCGASTASTMSIRTWTCRPRSDST